jgi:hypothetical protein
MIDFTFARIKAILSEGIVVERHGKGEEARLEAMDPSQVMYWTLGSLIAEFSLLSARMLLSSSNSLLSENIPPTP